MVGHRVHGQQLQQQEVPQLVVVHQQRCLPTEKCWGDAVDNAVVAGNWDLVVGTLWPLRLVLSPAEDYLHARREHAGLKVVADCSPWQVSD